MDTMLPSEGSGGGSIPPEDTKRLCLCALDSESEARLLVSRRILLNDSALHRFVYRFISRREKSLCSGDILLGKSG